MATLRPPVFAGRFYPAEPQTCTRMLEEMFRDAAPAAALAAIVPHAGWVYSGQTAALAWAAIAAAKPEAVVIFGAVHRRDENPASVYSTGGWETPLGPLVIDEELAAAFGRVPGVVASSSAHADEHAIEVQLPLVKFVLPDVRIVPIAVRPGPDAARIGQRCAREAGIIGRRTAFVGSTDLTHYGPAFGFEPQGRGREGVQWARDVNDGRLIDCIARLDADGVLREAAEHRNACGPGAVAATIGVAAELGATEYQELAHTCSADVRAFGEADPENSVGYEAGIFVVPGR